MLSLSRQVLLAARDLPSRDDPTREAAAVAIDGLLRSASPRDIAELAAQARVSFAQIVFPQSVGSHRHMDPALLDAFPAPQRLAVAALLSTHRNGYVREVALHVLTDSGQPWVLPFMLLRCDDIVASLRASATAAVQRSLHPRYADALASSLGLLAQLAERQRGGGGSVVPSVRSFLAEPPQRPALLRASHDADPRVRRLAYALRLAQPVGESPLEVLSAALGDPAIGVHTWAARTAISGATSESDQRALLPTLSQSHSAWVRSLALRRTSKLDPSDAPLEAGLMDHHAAVRLTARQLLRARHPARSFEATRALALRTLSGATALTRSHAGVHAPPPSRASTRAVVGALGALSDVGTRHDVELVHRFATDARPRVRKEAARTLALLSGVS